MSKVLRTLRTHWKKSIFFSLAGAYATHRGLIKYEEDQIMQRFCREASQYGQVPVSGDDQLYRVTVILNPAASKGKARSKFEDYCAPILHLAGIKVSVIRTEGEGQAKEIMEIMKDADAVLVAGGDGTVMEAVTGYLRRADSDMLRKSLPLGLLPVGTSNRLAKRLFPHIKTDRTDIELLASAAMACVKQVYRPMDVMEVENLSSDSNLSGKKIYGMTDLQIGAFRDAHERMPKYWYWAGLKKAMTYVFSYATASHEITWNVCSDIERGTRKVEALPVQVEDPSPPRSSSWWTFLWPSTTSPQSNMNIRSKGREEELEWHRLEDFQGLEVLIRSPNAEDFDQNPTKKELTLSLGPEELKFWDFVREGYRRENDQNDLPWPHQVANAVRLSPKFATEETEKTRFFSLDNESVEFDGPLQVSLIKDYLVMFCSDLARLPITRDPATPSGSGKWWQSQSSSMLQANRRL